MELIPTPVDVKPKIYTSDDHHIRDHSIDPDALYVLSSLRKAGYTAYLVGGGVRDLLLHKDPKDFDISTSARPEEVKKVFRNCLLIGRRFRLAHVRFGRKIVEVATFRAGETGEASLIVRDNEWGDPEEDVLRRDFTINGLFYDAAEHKIIDYVGGYEDLNRSLLRTIGDPDTRFVQDPVRMLRCLKFRARFGFKIDEKTVTSLRKCRKEILNSSQARLLEEMLRMLESGAAERFFRLLDEYNFLELLWPELAKVMQQGFGDDLFAYLEIADKATARRDRPPRRAVLLCCLLFPCFEERVRLENQPTLTRVHEIAWETLDQLLGTSFLQIPKRLKSEVAFVLECQYRLTPVGSRKLKRSRLVQNPDFRMALKLLDWRTTLNPELAATTKEWKDLYNIEKRW